MSAGAWIVLGVIVLVVLIVLEGKRQEKIYGPTRGANLMAAGFLELQRHLDPSRKVEVLRKEQEEVEQDEAGDGATAGASAVPSAPKGAYGAEPVSTGAASSADQSHIEPS